MNVLLVIINVTEMPIATIVAIKFIVNVKLDMMVMVISAVISTNAAKGSTIVILTQNVSTPLVPTIVNVIMGKVVKLAWKRIVLFAKLRCRFGNQIV